MKKSGHYPLFHLFVVVVMLIASPGCGDSDSLVFTEMGIVPVMESPAMVTGAVLRPADANLTLGRQTTLEFFLTFDDGTEAQRTDVGFESDDPDTVSIDTDSGVATAVMVGDATITATDGTFTASSVVSVTAAPVNNDPPLSLVVSNANDDLLDFFSTILNLTQSQTFDSGRNQGIVLDALGTALHNGPDSIAIISRLSGRNGNFSFQSAAFDANIDRSINLSAIADVSIKGSALAQESGLLTLANFSTAATPSLVVVGTAGASPINIPTTARPWDVTYDEDNDRLYVAFTDGTLGVYDDWLVNALDATPSGAADRTISPTGLNNAHGIALFGDSLLVSDVGPLTDSGDVGFDTDGEIYLISGASTADGAVETDAVLSGPETLLGNPVDIDLHNGDLRVAEKANGGGRILVFTDILNTPGGNIAPTANVDYSAPEALTASGQQPLKPDASDVDNTNAGISSILVAGSPGPSGMLFRVNPELTSQDAIFSLGSGNQSAIADGQGDVFVTGIFVQYGRLGNGSRDGDSFTTTRDRSNLSASTLGPRGLDSWDDGGLIFIANSNGGTLSGSGVSILGKYSQGAPMAFLNTEAAGDVPWDLDYDPVGDDLFVAFTNGVVVVYEDLVANDFVTDISRTRTVNVTGATNLHGIVHDQSNNRILVSDVGAIEGADNDDGAIHVINNADSASGAVSPVLSIVGANTLLEDPVDIAYDGTYVYVAENFGDLVMRFDISGNPSGTQNLAPEAERQSIDGPRSVGFVLN